MIKEKFIEWIETTTFSGNGDYWKELVDYGDNSYNEVDVKTNYVIFSFEDDDVLKYAIIRNILLEK